MSCYTRALREAWKNEYFTTMEKLIFFSYGDTNSSKIPGDP